MLAKLADSSFLLLCCLPETTPAINDKALYNNTFLLFSEVLSEDILSCLVCDEIPMLRIDTQPRLCRIHSYFCPNEVLEPLGPSTIPQTILIKTSKNRLYRFPQVGRPHRMGPAPKFLYENLFPAWGDRVTLLSIRRPTQFGSQSNLISTTFGNRASSLSLP